MRFTRVTFVTAMVLGLGLSACGVKGPLEPPPGPGDDPNAQAQKPEPEPKQRKGFLLDFLIQ